MSSNNSNRISGSEKIIPDGSEIQALRIARLHIESCRNLKEWKDADAVDIFPLYGSGKPSEITHYEIKVSSPEQRDSGYIIVSASEETSPIPVFAVSGKTFTERLRAKSGYTETRIVWHHPFSATAMDAKGEVVAVIGTEHKKKKTAKKKPPTGMIKPRGGKEEKRPVRNKKDGIRKAWDGLKELLLGAADYSGAYAYGLSGPITIHHFLIDDEQKPGLVFGGIPALRQFDIGSAKSGCGPTAWAALCCYFDLHFDYDLLYGTYGRLCDYIRRLVMIFHDRLRTEDGGTAVENMERGYRTVKEYLIQVPDSSWDEIDIRWFAYFCSEVDDFLHEMIWYNDHPAIAAYPTENNGHYGLAVGLQYTFWDTYSAKYALVQKQSGGNAYSLVFINLVDIDGAWTIYRESYQCPRKKVLESSSRYPMSMAGINDDMFAVYHGKNEKINILRTKVKGYPTPQSGLAPIPILFSGKIALNGFHPIGAVSACTYSYKDPLWPHRAEAASAIAEALGKKPARDPGDRLFSEEAFRTDLDGILGESSERLRTLTFREIPYLFLSWRDSEAKIHIAYSDIRTLSAASFTHYVLPDRILTKCDPAICIASWSDHVRCADGICGPGPEIGPLLYLAFGYSEKCRPVTQNMRRVVPEWTTPDGETIYFEEDQTVRVLVGEGEDAHIEELPLEDVLGEEISSPEDLRLSGGTGILFIIRLGSFFNMVSTGSDLWPELVNCNWWRIDRREFGLVKRFHSARVVFGHGLEHVNLAAGTDLFDQISLIWTEGPHARRMYHKQGRAFEDIDDAVALHELFVNGTSSSRPSAVVHRQGPYLAWQDAYDRIMVANQKQIFADTLEYTASGPCVQVVEDTLGNQQTVLGWFGTDGNRSMNHRLLFLGDSISDDDGLPL